MIMRNFFALLLTAGAATAQPVTLGGLTIDATRTFETPPTARAAGAYFSITNSGATPDALIDVTGDFPRVELHESYEDQGVMKMRPVKRLEIAPGATVDLTPGGLHVMIVGLSAPLVLGDEVSLTLTFEDAGPAEILLPVLDARMKGKATDRSSHD